MDKIKKSKTSKEFWKMGVNERNAMGKAGNWAQVTSQNQKTFDVLKLIDEEEVNNQIQTAVIKEDEYMEVSLDVTVTIKKIE